MNQSLEFDHRAGTLAQQRVWATGDFAVIALAVMPVAEGLVASADPRAGQRVLDVACGTGNVALVAARRNCDVVGVDFVPTLLDVARRRAAAEGTSIAFLEGDAQALRFPDASFDVVLSTFGVMFASDQAAAAGELMRVCKPGGTIGLASWCPEGLVAEFFAAVSSYAPPPVGPAPSRWGTETGVRELLAGCVSLQSRRRAVTEYFRSVGHALEVFLEHFGPVRAALDLLDARGRRSLRSDLEKVFRRGDVAKDGSLAITFEYLEVIARK